VGLRSSWRRSREVWGVKYRVEGKKKERERDDYEVNDHLSALLHRD
jgi:hypothetical protein